MKKAFHSVSMIAVICAVVLGAGAAMAQHTPVTTCPAQLTTPYTTVPSYAVSPPKVTTAVNFPAPGTYDFCAYLDTVYCSLAPVASSFPEVNDFAYLIQCLNADINGPLNLDPEATLPITPNGIPDGRYELAIMAAIMNNTAHPKHAEVMAAFQANYNIISPLLIQGLINEGYNNLLFLLAPHLAGGLIGVLSAYSALDDPNTNAAIGELMGLLEDIGVTAPDPSVLTGLAYLGPLGDADGDGATNKKEYQYFVTGQGYSASQYVAAALDAAQAPPNVGPKVIIVGAGIFEEGAKVRLSAAVSGGEAASYQWYKNSNAIDGQTGSTLSFASITPADAGLYQCYVDVPEKEIVESDPVAIRVAPPNSLPVAGGLGLALLAGACALAGAAGIRRK